MTIAGWSSLEAREAHNLKVAGSNPAPATSHLRGGEMRRIGLLIALFFSLTLCQYSLRMEVLGREFAGLIEDHYTDLFINPAKLSNYERNFEFLLTNFNSSLYSYQPFPLALSGYLLLNKGNRTKFGLITPFEISHSSNSETTKDTTIRTHGYDFSEHKESNRYGGYNFPLILSVPIGGYKTGLMLSPNLILGNQISKDLDIETNEYSLDLNVYDENLTSKTFVLPLTFGLLEDFGDKEYAIALKPYILNFNQKDAFFDKDSFLVLEIDGAEEYVSVDYEFEDYRKKEKGFGLDLTFQGRWKDRLTKNLFLGFSYNKTDGEISTSGEDFVKEAEYSLYIEKNSFNSSKNVKREKIAAALGFGGDYRSNFNNIDFRYLFGIKPLLKIEKTKEKLGPDYLQYIFYSVNHYDTLGYVENEIFWKMKETDNYNIRVNLYLLQGLEISSGPFKLSVGYTWQLFRDLVARTTSFITVEYDSIHRVYTDGPQTGESEVSGSINELDLKTTEEERSGWLDFRSFGYGISYRPGRNVEIMLMEVPSIIEEGGKQRVWFAGISIGI